MKRNRTVTIELAPFEYHRLVEIARCEERTVAQQLRYWMREGFERDLAKLKRLQEEEVEETS